MDVSEVMITLGHLSRHENGPRTSSEALIGLAASSPSSSWRDYLAGFDAVVGIESERLNLNGRYWETIADAE